jgi:outer membrane protein assembly factor BamB
MIGEATLISLDVRTGSRQVIMRLGVPASSGPESPRREWTLLLHGVSRVAAWLRRVQYEAEPGQYRTRPGQIPRLPRDVYPPERLRDERELNDWLRHWSGHTLSGPPGGIFDAADLPVWPGWASLDLAWPEASRAVHTLDLWLGDNAGVGGRMLDLRIEFGRLEVLRGIRASSPGSRGPRADAVFPSARHGAPSSGGRNVSGRPGSPREPLAHRRQQPGRRGVSVRARRRRAAAVLAVIGVIVAAWLVARPNSVAGSHKRAISPAQAAGRTRGLPAAEAGLMPWHLAAPISREVAVAGPRGQLIVLGGLTSGGVSANGVYALRAVTGAARRIGALRAPLHDAAAAVLGGRALVFGGGSSATLATVQAFALPAGHSRTAGTLATAAGSMPVPRSDAAAVTIGPATYLVGGYDGARPDAQVLATTNGRTFTKVAALKIPVRYPAVAALGGQIFVFGGQAITGPHAGAPLDAIQAVDPARHTAAVIGHLPEPLAGAVAVTVGGEVFVAGGESSAAQRLTPGAGTTQLGPGESSPGPGAGASSAPTSTVSTIWAFDPATKRLLVAGRLQVPVSHAAVAVVGSTAWIVGGESHGALVATVQMLRPNRAFGTAGVPGAGSPYFGARLLIADRGNNRLMLLDDTTHLVWKYPSVTSPRDPMHFYFPDDAFFADHGTAIVSNQEQNETIVKIAYPSGKIIWSYGHPGHAGTSRGYLHEPDDAYLLKSGQVTVADAVNCRVLVINQNGTVAHQIGTSGVCLHHPPASLGSPNGDTPLPDGNLLISEINGSWVSEYTMTGKLVWTTQLPISYPSDPQQLGPDRYLIADYASPGQILEFNRQGRILYRYHPTSGPGKLNHPSLAEILPSGVIMANDDYNNRMVAIDPATGALVWQYGVTGKHGTAPGKLYTPDGFDLLLPNGSTPTHRTTG